jgi:hypothetical protein
MDFHALNNNSWVSSCEDLPDEAKASVFLSLKSIFRDVGVKASVAISENTHALLKDSRGTRLCLRWLLDEGNREYVMAHPAKYEGYSDRHYDLEVQGFSVLSGYAGYATAEAVGDRLEATVGILLEKQLALETAADGEDLALAHKNLFTGLSALPYICT